MSHETPSRTAIGTGPGPGEGKSALARKCESTHHGRYAKLRRCLVRYVSITSAIVQPDDLCVVTPQRCRAEMFALRSVEFRNHRGVATVMLSLDEQTHFYRRLAALLGAGMTAGQAFELASPYTPLAHRMKVVKLCAMVRDGRSVHSSLLELRIVPVSHGAILAVGETIGRLDISCKTLADAAERELLFAHKLNQELWNAKLTMCVALPFVVGAIGMNGPMSLTSLVLFCTVASFGGVLVTGFTITKLGSVTNIAVDRLISRTPCIGSIAFGISQSRFARSFAALHAAGVEAVPALRAAAQSSGSQLLVIRVNQALPSIEHGETVASALGRTDAISDVMMITLATGEAAGKVDVLMDCVAQVYEARTFAQLHRLCISLGVAAILIAGLAVGIVAVGFYGTLGPH